MKDFSSLLESYQQAVFQKDLEAFASIFDEKVRVFDTWQRWTYDGLTAWRNEALRYLENRLTWVAKKKAGVWKIIHQHTSGPVDFESMKLILRR